MFRTLPIAALLIGLLALPAACCSAAVTMTIDSAAFVGDFVNPTTGTVDVYVQATGDDVGDPVANFGAYVQATNLSGISSVTFTGVSEPVAHTDLFPGSPVTDQSIGAYAGGSSSPFDVSSPALFDNAGLMSFSFEVPAGETGTFDLVFSTSVPFVSDLKRPDSSSFNPTFSGATITITAVPEPASLAVLGVMGVGLGVRRFRSRRKFTLAS